MPWYAWALIAYFVIDRISNVALCGRKPAYAVKITPAFAVGSLISGALMVWAIVALAS